ncbi:MAG: hypothetical protein WD407_07480 [Rhodospirillales bacterium]
MKHSNTSDFNICSILQKRSLRGWVGEPFRERTTVVVDRCRYYYRVFHYAFGKWPALFYPLHTWRDGGRSPHQSAVDRETDIVIEGYPRSGNTFAVHAFRLAQDKPVCTADHLHVAAQIKRAVDYSIPACVLIRRPEDVVRSLTVKYPALNPKHALKGYISFYSSCWPYRDSFVTADFDMITRDFGSVIDAINQRFDTQFQRFEHTPDNVAEVFGELDRRNDKVNLGNTLASYLPNKDKEAEKKRLDLSKHETLLNRARSLYWDYLSQKRHTRALKFLLVFNKISSLPISLTSLA